jgi:HK97 family phage portal protein
MAKAKAAKPKSKRAPATLAPKTKKSDPEQSRSTGQFWPTQRPAGIRINEDTALTLGSVWACVKIISESLAGVPWLVYRMRPDGGMDVQREHPISWLLDTEASPETPAFQFRETMIAHALTWGNGYAEIERDIAGRPVNLWTLTPDRVHPTRANRDGRIIYEVTNPSGGVTVLERDEMFHLRGLGFDGLVGYSVIEMASRSIGLGLDMEENASALWANSSVPGGVLEHPGTLTDEAHTHLQESWEKRHGGPKRRGRLAILEEGMKYHGIALPNNDAQFVENRQFEVLDICRWFRVPPHKVFELGRATWANIEAQETDFVNTTIMPWATRFEQAANMKLFGVQQRGVYYTKFNAKALLRGDSVARADFYGKMRDLAAMNTNEIRESEDMNPIGPDGDKRLVPLNMTTLEKVGEDPPKPAAPPQTSGDPAQDDDEMMQDGDEPMPKQRKAARAFDPAPIVNDCASRIVRREVNRVMDARKRTKGVESDYQRWLGEFEAEHKEYTAKALAPLMLSLGIGEEKSADVAARHWNHAKEQFAKPGSEFDEAAIVNHLARLVVESHESIPEKEIAA